MAEEAAAYRQGTASEAEVLLDGLGGKRLRGGALLLGGGSQRGVHVLSDAHLHSLDRGGGRRGRQLGVAGAVRLDGRRQQL